MKPHRYSRREKVPPIALNLGANWQKSSKFGVKDAVVCAEKLLLREYLRVRSFTIDKMFNMMMKDVTRNFPLSVDAKYYGNMCTRRFT